MYLPRLQLETIARISRSGSRLSAILFWMIEIEMIFYYLSFNF